MCLKPESNKTVQAAAAAATSHAATKLLYNENANKPKMVQSTHSLHRRETKYDLLLFLLPALFYKITPVLPCYIIGLARMLSTHVLLTLHYLFADKDNYKNKLTQKQLTREKEDYLVGIVLHMWAQLSLQIIFPGMFFVDNSLIKSCAINSFASHIFAVEPLYTSLAAHS